MQLKLGNGIMETAANPNTYYWRECIHMANDGSKPSCRGVWKTVNITYLYVYAFKHNCIYTIYTIMHVLFSKRIIEVVEGMEYVNRQ